MTTAITLKDITIHLVVEQQGPLFDALEFFPTLSKEVFEKNRPWLQPIFIDPAHWPVGAVRARLCHKDATPKYPGRYLCRQS